MNRKPDKIDVHLENFEGPMDLLMHLIRKSNLDIYDIPIAQITAEYLHYLEIMQRLNLDVAGEFLVMAATLMQIKAKMLLPAPEKDEDGDGPDPRAPLVSMLEEYQRYKAAARTIFTRFENNRDTFYKGSPVFSGDEKYLKADLQALLDAVQKAFSRIPPPHEMQGDGFPLKTRIEKIQNMMKGKDWLLLDDVFASETQCQGIITCFMALLELVKQHIIVFSQDEACGQVRIYHAPEISETMLPFPGSQTSTPDTEKSKYSRNMEKTSGAASAPDSYDHK